jgi:hypothetical protein
MDGLCAKRDNLVLCGMAHNLILCVISDIAVLSDLAHNG